MTLGVCGRSSGIDSPSEGVVDVLGVMVGRGERAAIIDSIKLACHAGFATRDPDAAVVGGGKVPKMGRYPSAPHKFVHRQLARSVVSRGRRTRKCLI